MKSNKTCAQIVTFNNAANAYLAKFDPGAETKLCEPIRKIQRTEVKRVFEQYNDRLRDIQRDSCAVDPITQVILRESNGKYAYTREGEKACEVAIKNLNEEKFEIAMYEGGVDIGLTPEEKEAFAGFVIPEKEGEGA